MPLSAETREHLRRASTATLTTQLFKRGLRNVFIQGVHRMSATADNLVGEAFTLRNIPAREDLDHLSVFENPAHPQRKAIESVPPGQVLVIDCRRETRNSPRVLGEVETLGLVLVEHDIHRVIFVPRTSGSR